MSSILSGRDLNRRSGDVFGVFEIGQPDMIMRISALLRQCRADGERECPSAEEVADHLVVLHFDHSHIRSWPDYELLYRANLRRSSQSRT
jgi:hypothetical protein